MEFFGKIIFFTASVLVPTLLLMWFVSYINNKKQDDENSEN